ncbi:MAG: hypothetical protein LW713_16065, partial [Acetobacteraceae bacterium]|nr:hypothetical protein [Acetobacteraceae bacterium]
LTGKPLAATPIRSAVPGGGAQLTLNAEVESIARYDADGRWVGFSTKGDDGSAVSYELIG